MNGSTGTDGTSGVGERGGVWTTAVGTIEL